MAVVTMIGSIEHCINIISNNNTVFFELVSVVCNIHFNSDVDIARALTHFCIALASISSNYNTLVFNLLFHELMMLAPLDNPIEDFTPVGMDIFI